MRKRIVVLLVVCVFQLGDPAFAAWTVGSDGIPNSSGITTAAGDLSKVELSSLTGGFNIGGGCSITSATLSGTCTTGAANFKLWSRSQEGNICASVDTYYNNLGQQTRVPTTCKVTRQDGFNRGEADANISRPGGCGTSLQPWTITVTSTNIYLSDSLSVAFQMFGTLSGYLDTHVAGDDRWIVAYAGDAFARNSNGTRFKMAFNFVGTAHSSGNCGSGDSLTNFVIDSLSGEGTVAVG